MVGAGTEPGPHTIIVQEGSTVGSVARQLEKQGAIPGSARTFYVDGPDFRLARSDPGRRVRHSQRHRRSRDPRLAATRQAGPAAGHGDRGNAPIIVEERLAANPYLTGHVPLIPEGSVLPDSYGYERGETRASIVARMQSAMTKALNSLWPKRTPDCPIATRDQAVVLASIVEKETGKAAERPMIAGVYCNRLKIGMKLDADPTVIYPVTKGKPLGRRILRSELNADNGYNTYRRAGLPDGPIANPGKASIAAVLHPAPTKALYFVADGTGGHVFADTLAEHNANVAKWYAIRRARGQM